MNLISGIRVAVDHEVKSCPDVRILYLFRRSAAISIPLVFKCDTRRGDCSSSTYCNFVHVNLKQLHRQSDREVIAILNKYCTGVSCSSALPEPC
jgi:hypothetical protein